jgi:endonuclease G
MGYNPDFIDGVTIPLPALLPGAQMQAFNRGQPIDHTHHSVVFNQQRGLAIFSAHNLNGEKLVRGIRRRSFTLDPNVPRELQIDNDRGYKGFPKPENNPWDAGHLARRKDVHWPSANTAKKAEQDTSRWTNIAPQHAKLNQGPWLEIEDWLLDLADRNEKRMSVFTGPVFTATDLDWLNKPGELPIRIPAGYWKVAALRHNGELSAAAFLIWQTDVHPSITDFDPTTFDPVLEQVRVLTVEHLAGISFGDTVREADPLRFGQDVSPVAVDEDDGGFGDEAFGGVVGGAMPAAAAPGPARRVQSGEIRDRADIVL